MHRSDVPLRESSLAVREIELPVATERFVEAELVDRRRLRVQIAPPLGEGAAVVLGDVFEVAEAPVARAARGVAERGHRRDVAPGEDAVLDEVDGAAGAIVVIVRDRDRLHREARVGRPESLAVLEELAVVFVPHRFDHLDRHDLVVGPLQVAVVLETQVDPVGETRRLDPLLRDRVLLFRDRRRRHLAAVLARRMDRERAPTGADLEEVIARLQFELPAETIDLRDLRVVEGRLFTFEDPRAVGHRLVEEETEEVVREIVVGGDVLLAAVDGVSVPPVEEPTHGAHQPGEAPVDRLEGAAVAHEESDHRNQIGGAPQSVAVALRHADHSTGRDDSEERAIVHLDLGGEFAGGPGSESLGVSGDPQREVSARDPRSGVEDRSFREARLVEERRGFRGIEGEGDIVATHRITPESEGFRDSEASGPGSSPGRADSAAPARSGRFEGCG